MGCLWWWRWFWSFLCQGYNIIDKQTLVGVVKEGDYVRPHKSMDTATIYSTKTVGNATCTPYGAACILRGVVSELALRGR